MTTHVERSVDPLPPFADVPAMKTLELPPAETTVREKLRAIETIWKDLARDERQVKSPDWHFDELKSTRAAAQSGPRKGARLGRGEERVAPPFPVKVKICCFTPHGHSTCARPVAFFIQYSIPLGRTRTILPSRWVLVLKSGWPRNRLIQNAVSSTSTSNQTAA